ncbi:Histidinol dehydrogenase, chloroplastic [Glycine soja]|nr:Histidinol dehydrogenase, chloroplastic [Glycine soja]
MTMDPSDSDTAEVRNQIPEEDFGGLETKTPDVFVATCVIKRVKEKPSEIDRGCNLSSPSSGFRDVPKCPSNTKLVSVSSTKRPVSSWRQTRSHQSRVDQPCLIQKDISADSSDDETHDMNAKSSPQKKQKQSSVTVANTRSFKYVEPVRKKAERENLKGVECKQCRKFYDAVLPNADGKDADSKQSFRCEHLDGVSRHRYRYVPPMTPEGFWNIGFESEIEALGLFKKFNKGLGHFLGIDTFDPGGYLKGLKRRKEIIDYQYAWGYIMGNERLDANYVVPQWMPQFMCKSEARTLIVLDEVWTLSVVDQLMCRIPGCKFLVVSRPKFQMVLSYEVELLIEEDALSLFCHHAFGLKSIPLAANENLVKRVVTECGRLPLALKVEKIFGTGNQHVTAAKMILQNIEAMVSIGMPASPSEVLVIADKHVVPRHVAADLHSQVEHGPDSQVVPVISGEGVDLNAIEEELSKQCQRLPRGEFAAKALSHSFIVYAHDMLESIKFSNLYAPEHLIVNAKDADKLEDLKLKYNLEDKVALEAHGNVMNKNRKQQDTEQEPEKEERPRREINKPHYLRDFV